MTTKAKGKKSIAQKRAKAPHKKGPAKAAEKVLKQKGGKPKRTNPKE